MACVCVLCVCEVFEMLVSDTRGRCRIFVSVNSRVRGGERVLVLEYFATDPGRCKQTIVTLCDYTSKYRKTSGKLYKVTKLYFGPSFSWSGS